MFSRVQTRWAGAVRPDWTVTVTDPAEPSGLSREELARSDDRALVRAAVAGSREAFDLIVERHRRGIYQLCHRYVGRHEDASDLAQDVFVRAYRGLARFKGDASLGTWLYRIAVNVCLNRLSTRTPEISPPSRFVGMPDPTDDPARALARSEQARRVRRAIARLPKRQRTVLLLRVYQELSHQDIARVVGSSVGAVKANFFHALANLRKWLQEP
jgi:RNA polymerase sigma-70 factor (ECF subfamily)